MTFPKLEKAIRDACPETMELSFGCRYRVKKNGIVYKIKRERVQQESYCQQCQESKLSGQAFSSYHCGYCRKGFSHPNTGVPKYCDPCATKHGVCRYCKGYFEIIGHELTLAHVLRAIAKQESERDEETNNRYFDHYGTEDWLGPAWQDVLSEWDLTKNLDGQSDETKQFLENIICQ